RNDLFANAGPDSKSPRGGKYGHPISRPIMHPGSKGKGTFKRAVKMGEPLAMQAYRDTVVRSGIAAIYA
ncbi:MAG: hypothetical protein ACO307_15635, partial [Ilumatobacteraceae bacterium]